MDDDPRTSSADVSGATTTPREDTLGGDPGDDRRDHGHASNAIATNADPTEGKSPNGKSGNENGPKSSADEGIHKTTNKTTPRHPPIGKTSKSVQVNLTEERASEEPDAEGDRTPGPRPDASPAEPTGSTPDRPGTDQSGPSRHMEVGHNRPGAQLSAVCHSVNRNNM